MISGRQLNLKMRKYRLVAASFTLTLIVFLVYQISYTRNMEKVQWQLKFAYNSILQQTKRQIVVEKDLELSEDVIMENIAREQPNLPLDFWYRNHKNDFKYNDTCAPLPNIFGLYYVNIFWQVLDSSKAMFHLYAGYLDNRVYNPLGSVVRILGMVNLKQTNAEFPETFCQIWYDDSKEPILTKTFNNDFIWMQSWGDPTPGVFQPYLLTCILPDELADVVPKSVSLVVNACKTATNLLKINYNHYEQDSDKEDYAVCVKGLSEFKDSSIKLIEWFEWLKLIGINKIFMYNYHIHPQLDKVLEYYTKENYLSVTPLVLAGHDPNSPFLQYYFLQTNAYNIQFDLIAYNDCLLRNMYKYKYVIPLEINEILMPQLLDTVAQVFEDLSKDYAVLAVRKVTFVEEFNAKTYQDVPRYLNFLQNVYRTKDIAPKGVGIRCFYNTKKMLYFHNHYPLKALKDPMITFDFEPRDIYIEQHTEKCREPNCEELKLFDSRKWHYKNKLVANVERVLKILD